MIRRIIWIDRKRCDGLGDCPPFYPQQAFRFETRKVHSANGQKNRKSGNRSAGGRLFSVNMADKLMTFTVIVCITAAGIIPLWAVVVFFLKEAAMGVGALSMYHKTEDVIPSNWLGKVSTGVFFVVCAALVLFPGIPSSWATGLITLALVLTILAFVSYLLQYLSLTGRRKG